MIAAEVKYKKTGIDYIPEIPENWKIVRLKNLADVFGRIGFRGYTVADIVDKGQGAISLSPSNIDDQSIIYDNSTYISLEKYYESPEIIVEEGDTILVKTASVGKVALVRNLVDKSTINPQLVVFKNYKTDRIYFYYLLTSHLIQKQIERDTSGGVLGTITQQKIKNYLGTLPPIEEQKVIADYLDTQTAKITHFIQTKQRFIELLKEQRQSIITNAVTKGIDESVKMKETVLGEIPEHWKIRRLKFCLTEKLRYGANASGDYYNPNWYRYIRITDFTQNGELEESNKLSLSPEKGKDYELKNGDILLARSGATVGKSFQFRLIERIERCCYAGYLIKVSPNEEIILSDFLYNFTLSSNYENWKNSIFIKATIENISAEKYANLLVTLPPIDEQKLILEHIINETHTLDIAIGKAEMEIELIKEYREAMIAEAVTGKIKL